MIRVVSKNLKREKFKTSEIPQITVSPACLFSKNGHLPRFYYFFYKKKIKNSFEWRGQTYCNTITMVNLCFYQGAIDLFSNFGLFKIFIGLNDYFEGDGPYDSVFWIFSQFHIQSLVQINMLTMKICLFANSRVPLNIVWSVCKYCHNSHAKWIKCPRLIYRFRLQNIER